MIKPLCKSMWGKEMWASWWENRTHSTNKEIDLMQSAKMIYPDKKLAGAILCKVKKRYPNDEWSVIVVPTGFEVTRKPKPLFGGYSASCKPLAGSAKSPVPVGSVVRAVFRQNELGGFPNQVGL